MDHAHKIDVPLAHQVDVSESIHFLLQLLGCENWYVACHHERLFVVRLTRGHADRFAVRFECTAPVEKGIYHGSKAWSLSISPLHDEAGLSSEMIKQVQAGLAAKPPA
jgi:hypothetical protein